MKKLNAVFDAIICKQIELEEESYGSIVVPDMGNDKNLIAEIIDIGPGYTSPMGNFISTTLSKGQIIILPSIGPTKFELDREEYLICKEREVIAVINQ
jgi:chaperonin GroES